jgi:hypothetical protein
MDPNDAKKILFELRNIKLVLYFILSLLEFALGFYLLFSNLKDSLTPGKIILLATGIVFLGCEIFSLSVIGKTLKNINS